MDIASTVATQLPYLRRYARALTGSQGSGDRYAEATLMAILEDRSTWDEALPAKAALFRVFNTIWASSGSPVEDGEGQGGLHARAQAHLRHLTPNTREALLLRTVEEFGYEDIGSIMGIPAREARDFVEIAEREMQDSVSGKVLVIEDEAIIAMDIQSIVAEMGHAITGVGRTRTMAVEVGRRERPDLILADIQLADASSGIDAVNDLLRHYGGIPVIFITAFPERLLTGDKPEPAFLISKPYTEEQVRSAVSQAMFFASTEDPARPRLGGPSPSLPRRASGARFSAARSARPSSTAYPSSAARASTGAGEYRSGRVPVGGAPRERLAPRPAAGAVEQMRWKRWSSRTGQPSPAASGRRAPGQVEPAPLQLRLRARHMPDDRSSRPIRRRHLTTGRGDALTNLRT